MIFIFLWSLLYFFKVSIYLFWPYYVACGILVPQLGIKPISGVEPRSLNHWTSREVSSAHIFKDSLFTRMSPLLSYMKGTAASVHVLGISQACPLIWGFWFDITGICLDSSKLGLPQYAAFGWVFGWKVLPGVREHRGCVADQLDSLLVSQF